jgi:hypothetical protein
MRMIGSVSWNGFLPHILSYAGLPPSQSFVGRVSNWPGMALAETGPAYPSIFLEGLFSKEMDCRVKGERKRRRSSNGYAWQ